MKFPTYIKAAEVAKILEWPQWKARNWLISSGAAVKRGKIWVTTPELLRQAFPELWLEYLALAEDREGPDED